MTHQTLLLVAVIGGVSFSVIAWSYRAGDARGIPPCFVALGLGLVGSLWFAWRSFGVGQAPGWSAPAQVWLLGALNGIAQGCAISFYRAGLRHGPMAPLWCAANLVFVVPAIYALAVLGERLHGMQQAGMLVALLTVGMASLVRQSAGGTVAQPSGKPPHPVIYPAILLVLVVLPGLTGVSLIYLAATEHGGLALNPRYNDCFMLGLYGFLLIWVGVEALTYRRPIPSIRRAVGYAALAGTGSAVGMTLMAIVSRMPGGIGFATTAVSAILIGALLSSFGFGERRGAAWWATVGLAAGSVLLFNLAPAA